MFLNNQQVPEEIKKKNLETMTMKTQEFKTYYMQQKQIYKESL